MGDCGVDCTVSHGQPPASALHPACHVHWRPPDFLGCFYLPHPATLLAPASTPRWPAVSRQWWPPSHLAAPLPTNGNKNASACHPTVVASSAGGGGHHRVWHGSGQSRRALRHPLYAFQINGGGWVRLHCAARDREPGACEGGSQPLTQPAGWRPGGAGKRRRPGEDEWAPAAGPSWRAFSGTKAVCSMRAHPPASLPSDCPPMQGYYQEAGRAGGALLCPAVVPLIATPGWPPPASRQPAAQVRALPHAPPYVLPRYFLPPARPRRAAEQVHLLELLPALFLQAAMGGRASACCTTPSGMCRTCST